jgi:hypothetical protein
MYRMLDSFAFSGGSCGLLKDTPYVRIPAEPISDLACSTLAGIGAQLNWTPSGLDYVTVEIYRNNQLLSIMPGTATSYLDEIAVPGTYVYSVVAVNQDLPSTEVSCNVTITPPAPGAFTCLPISGGAALTWENQTLYDEIVVVRDGTEVGRLAGDQTSHIDPIDPGGYIYCIVGIVNLVDSPSGDCAMALAPTPPVIDPVTVVDPCSNTFALSWTNTTVMTSIIATLDGVLLANLPGEATSMSVTLDALGTQQLCLTPVADGVNGFTSCIDITAEGVTTTSPTVVDISIDPATYLATIQWDSPTQIAQSDVTVDGVPVASLPGSTLEVTIPIENSGPFTVCVGGNTICDDAIVPTCGEAIAPQRFQRGDTNANGGLDL